MHKIPWRFLCKSLWLGDYRGHISLAYPGTIPGAVNTLGGGSGLPSGRRSRRQIIHRRQAVGVGGSDGGGGRHGGQTVGRTADSSGSRQDGQPSASAASRAGAGDTKRAGPRRNTMPRRPAQEYHAAQAHRRSASASHPPPERPAIRQRRQPAGRRRYQTPAPAKIPRRAGPREILNAPARGTGGAAVVLCGFGSPKFF